MTLTEMQTYFQLLVAETATSSDFISTTEMTDLINQGSELFALETLCIRPTYISCTLATGVQASNLATNFLSVVEGVWLYDASGNQIGEITPIKGGYKQIIENDSSNGEPSEYCIHGFSKATAATAPTPQIIFDPPPSATYNNYVARVFYAKNALALSSATDVSDVPVVFHRGPVVGAVALMKDRDQELEQAQYFWGTKQNPRIGSFNWYVNRAKKYFSSLDKTITEWIISEGNYVSR
jgi:hypothetical protein